MGLPTPNLDPNGGGGRKCAIPGFDKRARRRGSDPPPFQSNRGRVDNGAVQGTKFGPAKRWAEISQTRDKPARPGGAHPLVLVAQGHEEAVLEDADGLAVDEALRAGAAALERHCRPFPRLEVEAVQAVGGRREQTRHASQAVRQVDSCDGKKYTTQIVMQTTNGERTAPPGKKCQDVQKKSSHNIWEGKKIKNLINSSEVGKLY